MTAIAFPKRLPLLGLEGIVLLQGSHDNRADGVCAMEAVAWLAGESHSDHPSCACPVISAFIRNWNDSLKDDETRSRLLRPLLPLLIGTKSTKAAVELKRSYLALDWLTRVCVPAWLSLRDDLMAHAVALRGLKPLVDAESCKEALATLYAARTAAWDAADLVASAAAARAAAAAARAAAWDAAWDAAGAAAARAAVAAARDAARDAAWDAAWAAAWDAAWAAAWDAAWDAARAAARDAAWDAAVAAAWDAAVAAARDAAGAAAGDAAARAARDAAWAAAARDAVAALAPTVTALQASASELVKRMVACNALGERR